ncbi:hypothetical protein KSP39_PZI005977 [Platanthera zijinensis]|uniref:Small ribosomal subunit protein uS14m n=1 Tax=Platanthera zijinensis TaxID=2320716 RepID=A0AAP0BTB9_9ASPA
MLDKRNLRDHKRRLLAAKYELRRKLSKAFCQDPDLPSDMRDKYRSKLSKLPRKSSFARVRNRCISTGRPRGVLEFFRISRLVFRGLASRGHLIMMLTTRAKSKPSYQRLRVSLVYKGNSSHSFSQLTKHSIQSPTIVVKCRHAFEILVSLRSFFLCATRFLSQGCDWLSHRSPFY